MDLKMLICSLLVIHECRGSMCQKILTVAGAFFSNSTKNLCMFSISATTGRKTMTAWCTLERC